MPSVFFFGASVEIVFISSHFIFFVNFMFVGIVFPCVFFSSSKYQHWLEISSVLLLSCWLFHFDKANTNVTQPRRFLVGMLVLFFVENLLCGCTIIRYERQSTYIQRQREILFLLHVIHFHFYVILVDLLVQVQNVKKILIY